jgi:hypothetical protein
MILDVIRDSYTPTATLGRLLVNGVYCCFTLEPANDPTLPHPCIPLGNYVVTLRYSVRFQQTVPYLHDVPGRSDIEIHVGNTVPDTHGCILVGEQRFGTAVLHSRDAFNALLATLQPILAKGEHVSVTVSDAKEAAA